MAQTTQNHTISNQFNSSVKATISDIKATFEGMDQDNVVRLKWLDHFRFNSTGIKEDAFKKFMQTDSTLRVQVSEKLAKQFQNMPSGTEVQINELDLRSIKSRACTAEDSAFSFTPNGQPSYRVTPAEDTTLKNVMMRLDHTAAGGSAVVATCFYLPPDDNAQDIIDRFQDEDLIINTDLPEEVIESHIHSGIAVEFPTLEVGGMNQRFATDPRAEDEIPGTKAYEDKVWHATFKKDPPELS